MPSIVTEYIGLSDRNNPLSKAEVVSKRRPYADLDLNLEIDESGDIKPLLDLDAVKASVRNLILTNFGERPFRPNIGSNVRALLFEPADVFTIYALREAIRTVLLRYEPRVDSITVQVRDDSDENRYVATVGFRVISFNEIVDIDLYLSRTR
jgi:phage baseplate assembly protein W